MFIFVLRKERAFTCTFQVFSLILKTRKSNPEDQEMLFSGWLFFLFFLSFFSCFVLFTYLFYMDKWNVFCHTNICSLSCAGPGESSRVVTMQAHTDLECLAALCLCILPWCISAGTWQFSRCYKGHETCYWKEQLAACVSQKRPGPAWCSCCSERRRLCPGWGEEGALALWKCWIIIPV